MELNNRTFAFSATPGWILVVYIGIVWVILFGIRLAGPFDIMDNDQERPASYALDAVRNGNWIVQQDETGDITSKPPLFTWLVAIATIPFGRISPFTLFLPCALAALALAWLMLAEGGRHLGFGAGFLGTLAFLLSLPGIKLVALARTDTLFALTVFGAALLAYRAWTKGKGWTWFWLASAAATLTKGPLGVLLAAGGLLAVPWEYLTGRKAPLRGSHWLGILLFLVLTAGWFALAIHYGGAPVYWKMIGKELMGLAVSGTQNTIPGTRFYIPFLYFLSRFFPWSPLTCLGLWRIWAHPAVDEDERRFERCLAAYFIFGLVVFGIGSHHRPDHLFPLLPAAALLCGRELARLLAAVRPVRFWTIVTAASLVLLAAGGFLYIHMKKTDLRIVQTDGMRRIADTVLREGGAEFPLMHFGHAPYAIQFYLNTMRPRITLQQMRRALGLSEAVFIAVKEQKPLENLLGADAPKFYEVARWPDKDKVFLKIVSNHPRLELTTRTAVYFGPLLLRMDGARLVNVKDAEFVVQAISKWSSVSIANESAAPCQATLRIVGKQPARSDTRMLMPGEIWRMAVREPASQTAAAALRPLPGMGPRAWQWQGWVFLLVVALFTVCGGWIACDYIEEMKKTA
ncbi:MAG: glycosyltransferase family 39 protein [bacterium]